jgi:hypothetical protein
MSRSRDVPAATNESSGQFLIACLTKSGTLPCVARSWRAGADDPAEADAVPEDEPVAGVVEQPARAMASIPANRNLKMFFIHSPIAGRCRLNLKMHKHFL